MHSAMTLNPSILAQRATQTAKAPLVRSASALIASTFAGSGLGFVYWVAAARLFTVSEIGLASAALAAMMLVTNLSLCGVNFLGSRLLPIAGARRLEFSRRIQLAAAALGAGGGALFLLGSPLWAEPLGRLGLLFVAATALWTVLTAQDHLMLGLGRAVWVPIRNGSLGILRLVLLLSAVLVLGQSGWLDVFWPWFISAVVGSLGVWIMTERFAAAPSESGQDGAQLPRLAQASRFALAHHLGSILLQLPALVYPVLVLHLLGEEATAYFYISWRIAQILMLTSSNIASAMVTQMAYRSEESHALLMLGVRYAMALVLPGVACFIVFARPMLSVFGSSYQEGYGLLAILALGCLVYPVNAFYAGLMRARFQLKPVLIQGGIAGALSLGLVWPLGSHLGLAGFGIAYVVGQGAAALFVLFPSLLARCRTYRASKSLAVARP